MMIQTIEAEALVSVCGGIDFARAASSAGPYVPKPQPERAQNGANAGAKMANGTYDYNRSVDNGNRYAAVGGVAGSVFGAPGAAVGAALGWAGGFMYDVDRQGAGK